MDNTSIATPSEPLTIDAHQHFWNYDPVRDAWITEDMRTIRTNFTPYDLYRILRENDIDGCIAVQADQSENETAFLVDIAERNDFVKGVVGWVDLTSGYLEKRLEFYHRTTKKLKGFRHIVQTEPDNEFLLREDFCRGISLLNAYKYTYDILIFPKQLPAAIRFVEMFPDQRFVVDHIAKPDIKGKKIEPWASQMKEISKNPNVYCKVSGMVTEADWRRWKPDDLKPYLDIVFDAFGTRRLMFGSDWPVCLVAAEYSRVKEVIAGYLQQFSPEEQKAVMGGNAALFYYLNDESVTGNQTGKDSTAGINV
jgi:L-fuconolactonase